MSVASLFVNLLGVYFGIGLLFAIVFQFGGAKRIDTGVEGTSIWFKLLIFPGTIAFWPALLRKWIKAKRHD